MTNRIQIKRGNLIDIPILSSGEFGFTIDTEELYIGSGASNIRILTQDDIYNDINVNALLSGTNGINYSNGVISPTYGTESNTICQGNDIRLIPSGGLTGQILTKTTDNNYEYNWSNNTNSNNLTISDIIPNPITPFWWDTTDGNLYIRYNEEYIPAMSIVSGGGGSDLDIDSIIYKGITPTTTPFWWDTAEGNLYIKYEDNYISAMANMTLNIDSIIYKGNTPTTTPFYWDNIEGNLYIHYENEYVPAMSNMTLSIDSIIKISSTPPNPPSKLWWNELDGNLYIYYGDEYVSVISTL